MSSDTRNQLLLIFERHRACPGAPYEEDHFLDFLLAKPVKTRAVYDSFSGLRRYNAFVNELQMHFGIHLSGSDFDANYSVDRFVERINAIQASPRSSLAAYRNAKKVGFGWLPVVVANGVGVLAVTIGWRASPALAYVLLGGVLLGNLAVMRWYLGWRRYRNSLYERITSASPRERM